MNNMIYSMPRKIWRTWLLGTKKLLGELIAEMQEALASEA